MDEELQTELLYYARRISLRYYQYVERGDPDFIGLDAALEKAHNTPIGALVLMRELSSKDRSLPLPLDLTR